MMDMCGIDRSTAVRLVGEKVCLGVFQIFDVLITSIARFGYGFQNFQITCIANYWLRV